MGLAASQARLLSLTSRMSDLEFAELKKSNEKQRLSVQSEELATAYTNALNQKVLQFSQSSGATVTMSAKTLMSCGLDGNNDAQRLLVNTNGQIMVSEDVASKYAAANGDLNTFLASEDAGVAKYTQVQYDTQKSLVAADTTALTTANEKLEADTLKRDNYVAYGASTYVTKTTANTQSLGTVTNQNSSKVIGGTINTAEKDGFNGISWTTKNQSSSNRVINGTVNTAETNSRDSLGTPTNQSSSFRVINGEVRTTDNRTDTIFGTVTNQNDSGNINGSVNNGSTTTKVLFNTTDEYAKQYKIYNDAVTSDKTAYDKAKSKLDTDQALLDEMGTDVSTGEREANTKYYTRLFNQIKDSGYSTISNSNINDSTWLTNQLENGNMYLKKYSATKTNDDGSIGGFNSEDWASGDNQISETTDASATAKATAEYDAAMAKINAKDKQLDLDMKNIDTEHNAVQTEYDSVKKIIDKNIERSFKFFNG